MKPIVNNTEPFFNIVKFANDPDLWEKRKRLIYNEVEKDLKRKEFIEKHLSENFKNLIPNKALLDSMSQLIGYSLVKSFQSPDFKFILQFIFTDREIFNERYFKFEIKLRDISTKCKVTNKKELTNIFHKLLYRIGFEIGYIKGMMERIELDLKIIRDEREGFTISESIQDVQHLFYNYAVNNTIINDNYSLLFEHTDYIIKKYNIKTQSDLYSFIADIREKNINLRVKDRLKLEESIRKQYQRLGFVPKFKDIMSNLKQSKMSNLHKTKSKSYVDNNCN